MLYIVSTPIGNLEDITQRAIRVLKEVSIIAAEDTRHTQKLLNHYQIETHQTSYHDHNKEEKAELLISKLKEGKDAALVCDAGTPGVSDPGYYLIKRAIEENIKVVPVPGVSAVIAGLSVSGLPTDRFVFEGFLPQKKNARIERLKKLEKEERTIILYEAPHRFIKTLKDIHDILGNRRMAVARELTKIHEEIVRGTVEEIIKAFEGKKIRGEVTIILEGAKREAEQKIEGIKEAIQRIINEEGVSRSEAARRVAIRLGISKKRRTRRA